MLGGRPPCPRCGTAMAVLWTAGRRVTELDHCSACALVWFDPLEFDGLDRRAWVDLLLEAAAAPPPLMAGAADRWRCPRCGDGLSARLAAGDHGRHLALACPHGHGHAHGVAALLASRGLLRPLDIGERLLLQRRETGLACLSCGAAGSANDEACSYCRSPLLGVDVPRLAVALGARDAAAAARGPALPAAAPLRWGCHGCGQVLDPSAQAECPQCGLALQAPRLADLVPLLEQARERLAREQAQAIEDPPLPLREDPLQRVADLTGRPEHRAAAARADARWWWRLGLIAAAFGAALLTAWCNGDGR